MTNTHKRILLVDDETRIRTLLRKYLEKEGYVVEEADSGEQAILNCCMTGGNYDLMVLDWLLPDISGIEICKHVKLNHQEVPILMLSGRAEEKDRIEGFKAGVDDYVVKPFSPREVVLRIQSILARTQEAYNFDCSTDSGSQILIAEIVIQPSARRVLVQRNEIHLTPKEYDLLYFLVTNQETAFSRRICLRKYGRQPTRRYMTSVPWITISNDYAKSCFTVTRKGMNSFRRSGDKAISSAALSILRYAQECPPKQDCCMIDKTTC